MRPARSGVFAVAFALSACVLTSARDGPANRPGPVAPQPLVRQSHGGAPDSVYDGTYYDYARVTRVEPVIIRASAEERPEQCDEQDAVEATLSRHPIAIGLVVFSDPIGYDAALHRHYYAHGAPIGDRVGPRGHCERAGQDHVEERIGGYRVTYAYEGKTHVRIVDVDPGSRIRVRVSVALAG